jgi:hypothetical protein
MGTVGHRGAALANFGGAGTGIESAGLGNIHRALVECAKGISPRKTWAYLASLIGASERVAKHRMAGSREFSIDELARMLRSERGIDYLVTIMGNAEPQWWHAFKKQVAVSDSIRMQRAARRKLQEAIDADADLTAAIARAVALSDPEFHRPHVDALSSTGRVLDRAVAPAAGRSKRK